MARKTVIPSMYYGEPRKFDPKFRGPIHNRERTDVICCVIFVTVIFAYIILGIVAWLHGDLRKAAFPTDSYGKFCGEKENINKTKLFYTNIIRCMNPLVWINLQCPTTQLCVSKCPDKFMTLLNAVKNSTEWLYYKQFCRPGVKRSTSIAALIRNEDCPSMIWPSTPFLKRCFPTFMTSNGNITNQTLVHGEKTITTADLKNAAGNASFMLHARDISAKIIEDFAESWKWILTGMAITMVISLIFLLLLRFIASALVWLIIGSIVGAVGYGIGHCYWEYQKLIRKEGADITISELGFNPDFHVYLELSQTWFIFMIVLSVIEGIILLILIFLRERLLIAIALLKEASKAVSYVMTALIYPIFTFFLLCLCIGYGAVVAMCLATSGVAIYTITPTNAKCQLGNNTICDPKTFDASNLTGDCAQSRCFFNSYGHEDFYHSYILLLQVFNVFAFLWLVNFVIALGQCTLAGAFASYYWALRKPKDIPAFPLLASFNRAIRFHIGSLALGALILSLVQMIRIGLEYLDQKLKGSQTAFARFMMSCLKYCFWCLERFIKFLNRNAYIMIAIHGKSFCTSSKDAFFLLMRNVLRVAVLDKVTDFLLFLGKLLIAGTVGALAFFFFTRKIPLIKGEAPTLNYYWVPLVMVILVSYLVAHGFFSVYSICVDTLFLCFCEDLERNDGSLARPYYMSPELCKILGKNNEVLSSSSSASE
ncbi:choline transporter-like protein 5 [Hippocampus zosterae]|uniref:choline transporter-like protein 5 n=1 Tax=Hippocampus zosterae TaxID=109293 RepID=UPI00223CB6B8|nr:choline transporter-like protein 5 [Hippocampus zosterae]